MPVFGRSTAKDGRDTDTSTVQSSPTQPTLLQKPHPPVSQSGFVDRKTSTGSRKFSFLGNGGGSKRREMTSASVDDVANLDRDSHAMSGFPTDFAADFGVPRSPPGPPPLVPPRRQSEQRHSEQQHSRTGSDASSITVDKKPPVISSSPGITRKPVQLSPEVDKVEGNGSPSGFRGRITIEQAQQKMKMAIEAERMADIALENARRQVREVKELMAQLQREADEE